MAIGPKAAIGVGMITFGCVCLVLGYFGVVIDFSVKI